MAKIKTVRIIKTKYGTFSLHYTNPDGRRRRLSVGPDYQQALRISIKSTDYLLEGRNPEQEILKSTQREKAQSVTIREFYPTFMEVHGKLQSPAMQKRYEVCFKNICRCPQLVDCPLGSITKPIVHDYMLLRVRQDGISSATANREAAFIRVMLSIAAQRGLLEQNPLQGFKLLKESDKRDVYLSVQEAEALINELTSSMADIVEFAIYSGIRRENILSLVIKQVRFHDLKPTGQVQLKVKGGRWETFPLGSQAVKVLKQAIGNRCEGFVFINPDTGTRYNSISKSFFRTVRKLGLKVGDTYLRFHDLRHVFCTWLSDEGVSRDALQMLLGHRDRATTDRYTTLNPLTAGKLLEKLPEIRSNNTENMARIGKVGS